MRTTCNFTVHSLVSSVSKVQKPAINLRKDPDQIRPMGISFHSSYCFVFLTLKGHVLLPVGAQHVFFSLKLCSGMKAWKGSQMCPELVTSLSHGICHISPFLFTCPDTRDWFEGRVSDACWHLAFLCSYFYLCLRLCLCYFCSKFILYSLKSHIYIYYTVLKLPREMAL